MAGFVSVGDVDLWVDERGEGPAVLLIAGLGDPAEAWTRSFWASATGTA